jgi:hypothetical protein
MAMFLGSGEAEHHGRRKWHSKVARLMEAKKYRLEKAGYKLYLTGLDSSDPLPPTGPHFLPIIPLEYDSFKGSSID